MSVIEIYAIFAYKFVVASPTSSGFQIVAMQLLVTFVILVAHDTYISTPSLPMYTSINNSSVAYC